LDAERFLKAVPGDVRVAAAAVPRHPRLLGPHCPAWSLLHPAAGRLLPRLLVEPAVGESYPAFVDVDREDSPRLSV